ncbi:MAG: AMP-binding protein [Bacillota bacterium]
MDDSLILQAEAIAPILQTVKGYVIMTDKDMAYIETKLSPVSSYEVLLKEAEPEFDWPMIDETSAFTACYTSGTSFQSGSTEPPIAMMREWKELTGAEAMFHAYGATETSPLATFNELKPDLEQQLSELEKWELLKKQGFPVMGVDLKIVDEKDQELPWDGISSGEILIRGPWITGSYYNDPRTAEAFSGGYWRSGDSATIDCHGYVKLIDRIKDLIKSGGEWISSVDLENAIMGYSKVFEATVVGVYHPKWEERPVAFVVVKEEFKGKVTKEEIINFIVPKFAKWQLPDDIVFLNELPKTSVGKFNKKVLREEYRNYLVNKGASEPLE